MPQKHLHIVSFDIPFPPNYGGVIDVYYKAKALHDIGVKIHLHCFEYGRSRTEELNEVCHKVYYYPRKKGFLYQLSTLPYITSTRTSNDLIDNLRKDNHPILFEGLHSSLYVNHPLFQQRKKIVRAHNIEHTYYHSLAQVEKKTIKRWYFLLEAWRLKRFEKKLVYADSIAAISPADTQELAGRYKNVHHISAFHPNEKLESLSGSGKYVLYHGNLEIGENDQAALFLVNDVFKDNDLTLVIAGKNPSARLRQAAKNNPNITLKANIPTHEIHQLIREAHINVLPTFQATGIKLKLLAALYEGRHCVVNSPMVANTGLETLCFVNDNAEDMAKEIKRLMSVSFEPTEIEKRKQLLQNNFSNKHFAELLVKIIYP